MPRTARLKRARACEVHDCRKQSLDLHAKREKAERRRGGGRERGAQSSAQEQRNFLRQKLTKRGRGDRSSTRCGGVLPEEERSSHRGGGSSTCNMGSGLEGREGKGGKSKKGVHWAGESLPSGHFWNHASRNAQMKTDSWYSNFCRLFPAKTSLLFACQNYKVYFSNSIFLLLLQKYTHDRPY